MLRSAFRAGSPTSSAVGPGRNFLMKPLDVSLTLAAIQVAKAVCGEALVDAREGDPALSLGRAVNGERAVMVLVVIGTEEQTGELLDGIRPLARKFSESTGGVHQEIRFDRPGGA